MSNAGESQATSQATGYRRSTVHDIAERAGVSISTVSRVLNGRIRGSWQNSAEKVQRVRRIAEELNYRPDPLISSLMGGRSRTIGLVGVSIKTTSEMHRVRAVEQAAREDGYELYLATGVSPTFPDGVLKLMDGLVDRRVDGLLVMGRFRWPDKALRHIASMPASTVFVGTVPRNCSGVEEKRQRAIDALIKHLLDLGHQHVTYLGSRHDFFMRPYAKLEHYRKAARRHGVDLTADPDMAVESDKWDESSGPAYECVRAMLKHGPPPTALACFDDDAAIGAMAAFRKAGLRVPEDVSVAGFDGAAQAPYVHPPLTTIRRPRGEVGRAGYDLLKTMFDWSSQSKPRPKVVGFEAELVIRGTTGPPAPRP